MDRVPMDASKMHLRTLPDSLPAGFFPMINPSLLSVARSSASHTLTTDAQTLSTLSCTPCFNRRLFVPNVPTFRPKNFLDMQLLSTGEHNATSGSLAKYPVWSALHTDLEKYAQRYRLAPGGSPAQDPRASASPQPQDLSTMNRSDNKDSSSDESDQQESSTTPPSTLKFSIDSILGSSHRSSRKSIKPVRRSPEPPSPSSLEFRCDVRVCESEEPMEEDEEEEDSLGKMSSPDEKGLDGLLTDSDRFSWLQCTRYKPPKLPRSKKKDGSKKRKLGRNPRVPFTQHQVNVLEQKFRQTHYLSSVDVAELSAALNLTETRVKIWFQNRRARERRDRENIQLLQGGPATNSCPGQPKIPGRGDMDRLSPDSGLHRSPRVSDGPSPGLYSPGQRLDLPVPPSLGLAGLGAVMPPGSWPGPMLPKPSALAHFAGAQHRASAFTPVTYFSYS